MLVALLLALAAIGAPACKAGPLQTLERGLAMAPDLFQPDTLARDIHLTCPDMPGDLQRWLQAVRAGEPAQVDRSWDLLCDEAFEPEAPALWERRRLALACDVAGLPGGTWGFTMAPRDAVGAASLRAWLVSEGMAPHSADAAYLILAGSPQVAQDIELPVVRGPAHVRPAPSESVELVLGMSSLRLPSGAAISLDRGRLGPGTPLEALEAELRTAVLASEARSRDLDRDWVPPVLVLQADAGVEVATLAPLVAVARRQGLRHLELLVEVVPPGDPRPQGLGSVGFSLDTPPDPHTWVQLTPWGYQVAVDGVSIPHAPGCAEDGPTLCEALAPWVLSRTLRELRPSGPLALCVEDLPVGALARHAAVLRHRLTGPLDTPARLDVAESEPGPWFDAFYLALRAAPGDLEPHLR